MIIGISGKMQSGKDTIAEYLVEKYGFRRIAFANKIKELAKDLFSWDGEKDESGRKLLQDLGYAMRLIDEDVWINYALRDVYANMNFVTTDVRYLNEADIIKSKKNNILWRVERNVDRNNECDTHLSEIDLDDYEKFDATIDNNSSFKELYKKVDNLLKGKKL